MVTLIGLLFVAVVIAGYGARNLIPPAVALRLAVLSATGALVSGVALGLLLADRLRVNNTWLWGWSLEALLLASLLGAAFAVVSLVTRARWE